MIWSKHTYSNGTFTVDAETEAFGAAECIELLCTLRKEMRGDEPHGSLFVERLDHDITVYFSDEYGGDWKVSASVQVNSLWDDLGDEKAEQKFVVEMIDLFKRQATVVFPGVRVQVHDYEEETPVETFLAV